MFNTLEFAMLAVLVLDMCVTRGAALLAWAKGAGATVVADVKKL